MDHTQFLYSINVIFLHRDKKNSSTTRKITLENVKAVALYRNYLLVNYEWHHYNKDKMLFFVLIFTVLCFYVIIIRSYIIILSILFFICHHQHSKAFYMIHYYLIVLNSKAFVGFQNIFKYPKHVMLQNICTVHFFLSFQNI
jgi:hypothetical protein